MEMDRGCKVLQIWPMHGAQQTLDAVLRAELTLNTRPALQRCGRYWEWSRPPLEDWDVWCVLDGEGILEVDSEAASLTRGRCFLLRPGSVPRGRQNPERPLTVFFAHMDIRPANTEDAAVFEAAFPKLGREVPDVEDLHRCGREAIRLGRSTEDWARARALLRMREALLLLGRPATAGMEAPPDERIERVVEVLEEHPERPWTVEDLARLAGLSRTQFNRLFARQTGLSPVRFLIRVRVDRARQLLRESSLPVGRIAASLGYRDVFFFSRQFSRESGRSPQAYRERA